MIREGFTFKLYSTNLYSVKADSLVCSIGEKNIDGIDNIFAVVEPQNPVLMYMDNRSLHVGYSINLGREFLERKGKIEGKQQQEILSTFRGLIFNYPDYQLNVEFKKDESNISCDIIRVRGGYKRKPPYFGYAPFGVDFIEFAPNGEVKIIKQISNPDEYDTFVIKETPKIGQVLSRNLDAIDLEDYIDGVKRSYQGRGIYNWKEVKGEINSPDSFSYLDLYINLEHHHARLHYSENLDYREYEVISHASFDPGPEECYESTDKFIWAAFSFDESYLLNFLAKVASVSTFTFKQCGYSQSKIEMRFNDVMTKSEFEELTGIHLFELISHTSG